MTFNGRFESHFSNLPQLYVFDLVCQTLSNNKNVNFPQMIVARIWRGSLENVMNVYNKVLRCSSINHCIQQLIHMAGSACSKSFRNCRSIFLRIILLRRLFSIVNENPSTSCIMDFQKFSARKFSLSLLALGNFHSFFDVYTHCVSEYLEIWELNNFKRRKFPPSHCASRHQVGLKIPGRS